MFHCPSVCNQRIIILPKVSILNEDTKLQKVEKAYNVIREGPPQILLHSLHGKSTELQCVK